MIPLDKLKSLQRAYVHANCPDGVASALILKDALPDLDVHFVKYDTKEHKEIEPQPHTIFCDFSPWLPKSTAEFGGPGNGTNNKDKLIYDWNEAGVIVLDHHDRAIVEPYTFGVFGENDKLECGAMLAYREVWLPLRGGKIISDEQWHVRNLAELAAVRDTWQREAEDWNDANEQASLLMFFRFDQLTIQNVTELRLEGLLAPRLFERQIELAHSCIKEAYPITSEKGTRVLMFQGVSATSDAAELVEKREQIASDAYSEGVLHEEDESTDLIVGFHYRNDGGPHIKLQLSTRSHTGFDCRALAQAHGGNGHVKAAGFTIESRIQRDPYEAFRNILNDYEAKL